MSPACPCCGSIKVRKINSQMKECENERCKFYKVARQSALFRTEPGDEFRFTTREALLTGGYRRAAVRYE